MAKVYYLIPFDMTALNFNEQVSGAYQFNFHDDWNDLMWNTAYVDRFETLYGHDGMYYAAEFAGPELTIEDNQMVGGTITGYMRLDWD